MSEGVSMIKMGKKEEARARREKGATSFYNFFYDAIWSGFYATAKTKPITVASEQWLNATIKKKAFFKQS